MAHSKPIFFTLLLSLFAAFSCTTQRQVTSPDEWKGNYIQFGKGGGFTGIANVYVLLENGQLFEQKGLSNTFNKLESVDKKSTIAIFKQAATLNLPSKEINAPGNIYKQLSLLIKGKKTNIVWSDGNTEVSQDVNTLHQKLFSLIKN